MRDSARANHGDSQVAADRADSHTFHRSVGLYRPYKQWLYPLPSLAALAGWLYVYASASATALVWSTVWLAAGVIAFLGWARYHHTWPFGRKEIREAFLETQQEHPGQAA